MSINQRRFFLSVLILYISMLMFFLFFSFGRGETSIDGNEFRYNLIPSMIHLSFPTLSNVESLQLVFFNLGNFIGFIPLGILIPMLYKWHYSKLIRIFLLSIFIVEILQMVTFLGSFDINDIIVNALGVSVGYCAYKIGFRYVSVWKSLIITNICAIILSLLVIGFTELTDSLLTKEVGPVVELSELDSKKDNFIDKDLPIFEFDDEKIEPEINFYSSEEGDLSEFTYEFNGEDIVLSFGYGILDGDSEIVILVNNEVVETHSEPSIISSEYNLENVSELTITVKGNVKLWDAVFWKMKYWWGK